MFKMVEFRIDYAHASLEHAVAIERQYHHFIAQTIAAHLRHDPVLPTRKRVRRRLPDLLGANWELRCGPGNRFRVSYEVDEVEHVVSILGIGSKRGQRFRFGREEFIPMRIAPMADVKARLSAYVDDVAANGPLVITRNGRAVAVLVAPESDDDLESLLLAYSPRFQAMLERSRHEVSAGKVLTHQGFWAEVGSRRGERGSPKASLARDEPGHEPDGGGAE